MIRHRLYNIIYCTPDHYSHSSHIALTYSGISLLLTVLLTRFPHWLTEEVSPRYRSNLIHSPSTTTLKLLTLFRFVNTDSIPLLSTLYLWIICTTDSLTNFQHGYTTGIHHWFDCHLFNLDTITRFSHCVLYSFDTAFISSLPITYTILSDHWLFSIDTTDGSHSILTPSL